MSNSLDSILSKTNEINQSIENIAAVSEQSAAGIEETAAGAQETNKAMEQVTHIAHEVGSESDKLYTFAIKFQLEK